MDIKQTILTAAAVAVLVLANAGCGGRAAAEPTGTTPKSGVVTAWTKCKDSKDLCLKVKIGNKTVTKKAPKKHPKRCRVGAKWPCAKKATTRH